MNQIKRKYKVQIIFSIIGAIAGFAYWKFIGCQSGTCAIKSVWYYSSLWGLLAGYLLGDILDGFIMKRRQNES